MENIDEEVIDDDEENKDEQESLRTTKIGFTPLHVISSWMESETLPERVTVGIPLQSGVVRGDFAINVVMVVGIWNWL